MNPKNGLETAQDRLAESIDLQELLSEIGAICKSLPDASRRDEVPWNLPYSSIPHAVGRSWKTNRLASRLDASQE